MGGQAGESMTEQQPKAEQVSMTVYIPPLWSFGLMVLGVGLCVLATLGGIILLGGTEPPPPSTPQLELLSIQPSENAQGQPTPPPPSPQLVQMAVSLVPNYQLGGATLAPVYLSPTPDTLSVGRQIAVINVGGSGLNVRMAPGINQAITFESPERTLLTIIGGPATATEDAYTWWQVQDPFTGQQGWAVDLYMEVQPK